MFSKYFSVWQLRCSLYSFFIIILFGSTPGQLLAAINIVGFGDSITKGSPYRLPSGNGCRCGGYNPILENLLKNDGLDAAVYNYGIGGEMTHEGLARIDSVLSKSRAHYVLLMEGTNDLLYYSPTTVRNNLWAMVGRARNRGVTQKNP